MKHLQWLVLSLHLLGLGACASGPASSVAQVASPEEYRSGVASIMGNAAAPAMTQCIPLDARTSVIALSTSVNQPGISVPVQGSHSLMLGDAECNVVRDATGMPRPLGQQFVNNLDVREKLISGGFQLGGAVLNGTGAALIANEGRCTSGSCGGQQFFMQGGQAMASSLADADAATSLEASTNIGLDRLCSGGCGAPTD